VHYFELFSSEGRSKNVKPVLDIVFCPSLHLFYDQRPFIPDLKVFLQNKNVFFQFKWLAIDVWVQETNPPLSALLSVSFMRWLSIKSLLGNDLVEVFRNHVPLF